jgi:hypothetical protein
MTKPGKTGNPHATESGYRRVSEIRVISALHWCISSFGLYASQSSGRFAIVIRRRKDSRRNDLNR